MTHYLQVLDCGCPPNVGFFRTTSFTIEVEAAVEAVSGIRCTGPVLVDLITKAHASGHDDRGEVVSAGEGLAREREDGSGVLRRQRVQGE